MFVGSFIIIMLWCHEDRHSDRDDHSWLQLISHLFALLRKSDLQASSEKQNTWWDSLLAQVLFNILALWRHLENGRCWGDLSPLGAYIRLVSQSHVLALHQLRHCPPAQSEINWQGRCPKNEARLKCNWPLRFYLKFRETSCDSFKPSLTHSGHFDSSSTWHVTQTVRTVRVLVCIILIDGLCRPSRARVTFAHRNAAKMFLHHMYLNASETTLQHCMSKSPREQAQIDQRKRRGGGERVDGH